VIATAEPDRSLVLLGKGDKITSAAQLKGKRITALAASGVWLTMRAQIDDKFNVRAKQDYEIVSVSNLGSGAAQVVAGTADYALAWEPFLSAATLRMPDLRVVLSADDLKDYVSWRLILGIHGKMANSVKDRQIRALAEAAQWLQKNPAEADRLYHKMSQLEPGIIERVLKGQYNPIDIRPLTAADIDATQKDLELVRRGGGIRSLPDAKAFYYRP